MPFFVGPHHHVVADMDHIILKIYVPHLQGRDLTAPERAGSGEHDTDPQLGVILGSGQCPLHREDIWDLQLRADLLGVIDDRHSDLLGLEYGGDETCIVLHSLGIQAGAGKREDKRLDVVGADPVDPGVPKPRIFAR